MTGVVVLDKNEQPQTGKYQLLPTFLLAAYQREHRLVQAQAKQLERQERLSQFASG